MTNKLSQNVPDIVYCVTGIRFFFLASEMHYQIAQSNEATWGLTCLFGVPGTDVLAARVGLTYDDKLILDGLTSGERISCPGFAS